MKFKTGDKFVIEIAETMEAAALGKDKEIKVGDVVVNIKGERYIVINTDEPDFVHGINKNGQIAALMRPINCVKTGKHIDIQCILDRIREE